MTTIAAGRLSETLQTLVDARLDTIDRMLLGRVNRQDRLAIVREVETQIFDLLHGRDTDSLDRDDVLAVLARLDPPEAYLPDEATGEVAPTRYSAGPQPIHRNRPTRPAESRLPKVSGILGIVSLSAIILDCLIFFIVSNASIEANFVGAVLELSLFGLAGLSFLLGLLAVITGSASRLQGGWAITGLVTGILGLFSTTIGILAVFVN
jgi:hypothetical protein